VKIRYDIATVPYEAVDALVDTDPIALRDLAWTAIEKARETSRDLAANESFEDGRLAIAEATIARLTGPEARERLARRLFLDAHHGDEYAQRHWDFGGDQHVNKEPWRAKADEVMAVIAGKEN
jgi:hypothetical protein